MILSKVLSILAFLIIFTIIVVSHEFGHYIIGRINGIKAKEFSIGMGPAIYKKQFTNTLFAIRILPLGGYCSFDNDGMTYSTEDKDEEEDSSIKDELKKLDEVNVEDLPEGSFLKAPVWSRIATIFAGPFFNFILAFLLSIILVWFCGSDEPIVSSITPGSAAESAGMIQGDRIVRINHENIRVWREISLISMMSYGEDIELSYERDGQIYEVTLSPKFSEEDNRYYLGFVGGESIRKCKDLSVFKYSFYEVRFWLVTSYRSLQYLFQGHASLDDFSGPVGMANVVDDTIETSSKYGFLSVFLSLLNLTILLSVNLGVMNLLPLPAIDGGRLLFLFIEAVRRKPVPPSKEGLVNLVGVVLLLVFTFVILFNDIMKIFR